MRVFPYVYDLKRLLLASELQNRSMCYHGAQLLCSRNTVEYRGFTCGERAAFDPIKNGYQFARKDPSFALLRLHSASNLRTTVYSTVQHASLSVGAESAAVGATCNNNVHCSRPPLMPFRSNCSSIFNRWPTCNSSRCLPGVDDMYQNKSTKDAKTHWVWCLALSGTFLTAILLNKTLLSVVILPSLAKPVSLVSLAR